MSLLLEWNKSWTVFVIRSQLQHNHLSFGRSNVTLQSCGFVRLQLLRFRKSCKFILMKLFFDFRIVVHSYVARVPKKVLQLVRILQHGVKKRIKSQSVPLQVLTCKLTTCDRSRPIKQMEWMVILSSHQLPTKKLLWLRSTHVRSYHEGCWIPNRQKYLT